MIILGLAGNGFCPTVVVVVVLVVVVVVVVGAWCCKIYHSRVGWHWFLLGLS